MNSRTSFERRLAALCLAVAACGSADPPADLAPTATHTESAPVPARPADAAPTAHTPTRTQRVSRPDSTKGTTTAPTGGSRTISVARRPRKTLEGITRGSHGAAADTR